MKDQKNILDFEAERLARFFAMFKLYSDENAKGMKLLIAKVEGVRIEVYPKEHMPPHFHVSYNGHHATYRIDNCELMNGSLGSKEDRIVKYYYLKQGGKKVLEKAWTNTRPGDRLVGEYTGNTFIKQTQGKQGDLESQTKQKNSDN